MRKRRLWMLAALIFGANVLTSCSSNIDNSGTKDDTPVRIGIAWRGDSTSISSV